MSFSSGLKKIEELHSLQPFLTTKSRILLLKLIEDLNNKLIEQCLNKFKPADNDSVMRPEVAEYAVKQLLRDDLRGCAIAEGKKALFRYNSGLLDYSPETMKKGGPKTKQKKTPSSAVFLKGIKDIRSLIFPGASLQPGAIELISGMLEYVSTKISNGAKNSAQQGQTITLNDLKSSIDNLLSAELRKHAQTEGAKMVFFLESGGLSVARKAATKSVTKMRIKSDKRKRTGLKRKKTSAIPAKKSRTVRSAQISKSPRVRRKRKMIPKSKKQAASTSKASTRKKPRKSVMDTKKIIPSKRKKKSVSPRKRSRSSVSKTKIVHSAPTKKKSSTSPKKRKPRRISKKIKRPSTSRTRRALSAPKKKMLPAEPSKKRKPSVGRIETKSPLTKKKRSAVVSRKKRSPVASSKTLKMPKSRKRRAPSKSPISQKRTTSVSRKKRIPYKHLSQTPSKRPVSKRRTVSASRKRTPSKSPAAKRRAVSVSEKKTPSKTPVSKRRSVKTPSKTPLSKRKAVSASRKKRTPSKSPAAKRRAVSVSGKKRKRSKISPSVSRKKTTPSKLTKTRRKKVTTREKDVSIAGPIAVLTLGIKNLNSNFQQSLSSGALKLINRNLSSLLDRLMSEIIQPTVGAQEVSGAVRKIFPPELRELAMSNLSRALVTFLDLDT